MVELVGSNKGDQSSRELGIRISGFSIRYPVSVCMLLLSFLVMGAVAVSKIPLVLLPNINAPFVVVVVPYPNATPEQIQETITRPVEEVLATIPNVRRLTSRSSVDQGQIVLEFGLEEDIDYVRAEIREKVEQVRKDLPSDVRNIYVQNFNTVDIPIIEGRISSGRDLRGSYDFLDLKIKRPLERVSGVAEVSIDGVSRREVNIDLRLDDLKRYRVDIDALFRKLNGSNLNMSLGRVEDAGYRFGVLTDGTVDSLEDLRNFPVNERGLLLSDIASVEIRSPAPAYGRHLNGEFAIGLSIRKASDANTVEVVDGVLAAVDELNRDPSLQGIEVLIWHDAGHEITNSLSGLLNAGVFGALLAVAVLFLFLRKIGATLAIGLSIPFSIVAAVGFMYLLGQSLNVLSMMGLMLSTGMLVDNAVVVLESIYRRLERGEDRVTAARNGTQGVIRAVIASTLTSIIIFVPLVFGKKSEISLFLGHTGSAIMITLACSLFISVTLIPLGLARFFRLRVAQDAPQVRSSVRRTQFLRKYSRFLIWTLRHPVWTVVGIMLVLASSAFPWTNLSDNSIYAQDMEALTVEYEFSENYHYGKIEEDFVSPVEAFLLPNREKFGIENIYSYYGNNEANTRIFFDEEKVSIDQIEEIRKEISEGLPILPGADVRLGQQEGSENRNFLQVSFYGEDPSTLRDLVLDAKRRLKEHEEFDEIFTGVDKAQEEVQLTLNRELARKYGVSPESVAGLLGIILRGSQLRGYPTEQGEIEVWIRLRPGDREDLNDMNAIVVGSGPDGEEIRLSQIADLDVVETPGSISREDRRTYSSMWINYKGDQTEEGKELISDTLNLMEIPSGYAWSFGFRTREREDQNTDFVFNLLLALFMVYFVMASLFESLSHPFAIMFSLVFAIPGTTWFLYLTGTPFNLMGFIGAIILVGIVVNNGIVLIDHINNLRRAGKGRSMAILLGCQERFRPILMTAATTVVGLLPLSMGTSGIFGLRYYPMARTVMGGLIASTILSLIVLPTVYRLIDDLSAWARDVWFASRPQEREEDTVAEEGVPA